MFPLSDLLMTRSRKPKNTKQKATVADSSQPQTLALSSLHEEVEALKQDQQWFCKQIKRKRTELKNLVDQLEEISREMFQRCSPVVQEMMERDREIHHLFSEVFTKRKLGKKSKKKIQNIYDSLQMDGIISPQTDEEEGDLFSNHFDEDFSQTENQDQETQQYQQQEEVSQPAADKAPNQRNIRETFLRLATRFHPDKVSDSETQNQYTAIMQEVNEAYQQGDFAKLLEIERQQHNEEIIVGSKNNESSLEKQRSQLIRENEVLKQQYEEIKQELRYLRRTPEGTIVTDYRRAAKEGIDPIAEMVEQAQTQLEVLTEIRDFVRDFRDKKITVEQFLAGPDSEANLTRDEIEVILQEMLEL